MPERSFWDDDPELHAEGEHLRREYEEVERQRHANGHDRGTGFVSLESGGDLKMEKVLWAWPGWLARGKLHLLGGQKGVGKSTIAYDLFGQFTCGGQFPDGSPAPTGDVLIWSGEDDVSDTILPRMTAAGADRERVWFPMGVTIGNTRRAFDPAADIDRLVEASYKLPGLVAMLIDPLVSATAGDSHKNAETRRGLQPIVDFAVRRNLILLGITHFSKGTQGRDPIERITGSLAFGAIPRIVMGAAQGETEDAPRRLVRIASNIGPSGGGFEYSLRQDLLPDHDFTAQRVVWGNQLHGSPLELLEPGEARKTKQKQAAELLDGLLANGAVPVAELRAAATANGVSWRTIEAVKGATPGIVARKTGRGWIWEKQTHATPWAAQ